MRPGLQKILNMKGDKFMDPVTYNSRTVVRMLETLGEISMHFDNEAFDRLGECCNELLPLFYPLTGEEPSEN